MRPSFLPLLQQLLFPTIMTPKANINGAATRPGPAVLAHPRPSPPKRERCCSTTSAVVGPDDTNDPARASDDDDNNDDNNDGGGGGGGGGGCGTAVEQIEKLSLWMLPPEPYRATLQSEIDGIAARCRCLCQCQSSSSDRLKGRSCRSSRLPTFVPHVTILGGIERPSHLEPTEWADAVLDGLRRCFGGEEEGGVGGGDGVGGGGGLGGVGLCGVGRPIPCRFGRARGGRPVCVMEEDEDGDGDDEDDDGGKGSKTSSRAKWNQCCVSIMERNYEFGRAVELAHAVFESCAGGGGGGCEGGEKANNAKLSTSMDEGRGDGDEGGGTGTGPTTEGGDFDWTSTLKPPLREPHYSHAYGAGPDLVRSDVGCGGRMRRSGDDDDDEKKDEQRAAAVVEVEVPDDFHAVEAMLIWTHPATVEGVERWREVGRVRLC